MMPRLRDVFGSFGMLPAVWVGLAIVVLPLVAATAQSPDRPPNVVLIISDDQAWTDYSFLGHSAIETPHLDALAQQSLTFTRGYVPTSLCRPSLATIMTGLYPHQHGITGNDPPPATPVAGDGAGSLGRLYKSPAYQAQIEAFHKSHIDRLDTLAEMLGRAGYVSHQSGKWWEGSHERGGFTAGMTHGDPSRGGRHGDAGLTIGRRGLTDVTEFIDRAQETESPFFVFYAPFLPHAPHDPPQRLLDKYTSRTPHLPVAKYYAMCEWFDETCGELLAHLDERKLTNDTIVLYVTDNGWINQFDRTAYAPKSKRSPYDGGLRTPIMVRWPGHVTPTMDTTHLASSIDLVPTVLALCGIQPPQDLPGLDLTDAKAVAARDAVFGAIYDHDMPPGDDPATGLIDRWVIVGTWKLIDPNTARFPDRRPELYDLTADPMETADLAADQPDRVKDLRQRLDAWWKPTSAR